ncbi:MAG: hypothetical protein Q9O24_03365 [Gammaproteobacteria bacterium]|nr:hypothetical protein [Gammaproteobacteria bacterium]
MRQCAAFYFIVSLVGCADNDIVDPNSFLLGGDNSTVAEKKDSIQGLSMPRSLDFIQPKKGLLQRLPKRLAGLSGGNSDYALDEMETTVNEVSMQPLHRINFLLCLLAQSNFSEKVNQGDYRVFLNPKNCQGMSVEEEEQLWILNSTRLNNQSSQQVQIWIPNMGSKTWGAIEKKSATMLIELEILSAVNLDRPYGQFRMNFSTLLSDQYDYLGNEINTLRGSLWSLENSFGQTEVGFINLGDSFEQALHFVFNDQEKSGRGLSYQREMSGLESAELRFVVVFNDDYFYRVEDQNNNAALEAENSLCLARYEYDLQVQHYRLYHAEETLFLGKSVMAGERLSPTELSGRSLVFLYQHRRANDLNGRLQGVGEEFVLQYDAEGELKGLSNAAIALKAGTVLSNQTSSFILKPARQQQVMALVDERWCADLDTKARFYTADLLLPLASNMEPLSFGLADQPLLESELL